ncbi:MAG: small ribosomal subunit Rsm22 family protein [Opitutaceae bacterium]|nr:small ribosomal subunit Rsm22 family protein [Opitutaceae bacterium]
MDWTILDRLRSHFIGGPGAKGPYWRGEEDLAQYNATFGERIGWKWDTVLGELGIRGWSPPSGPLLDWGCGSGIAGRRIASKWPTLTRPLLVSDHSPQAMSFAVKKATEQGMPASAWQPGAPFSTLAISHVLNELAEDQLKSLLACIEVADAVIWVEPGTHAVSRQLASIRDLLVRQGRVRIIAPCTHGNACPLFSKGSERHWCHQFASPPAGIYADSAWVKFGQRAGIDLRSLPYAVLVMDRRPAGGEAPLPKTSARRIGRVDALKTGARWLQCSASGLEEVHVAKRDNPALVKALEKRPGLPLIAGDTDDSGRTTYRELHPSRQ